MGRQGNRIFGTALVAVGLLMLLSEMGLTGLGWLWPTVLLVMGIALLVGYYRERDDSGKAFTGVTLVLLAFFFHFTYLDVITIERHWPFFLLAPGIGLLVMSRLDEQRRDAMVPGWILVGIALVGYFFSLGLFTALVRLLFGILGLVLKVTVPVGLIGLGGWLLFSQRHHEDERPEFPEKVEPREADRTSAAAATASTAVASAPAEDDDPSEYGADADLPPSPPVEDADYDEDAGNGAPDTMDEGGPYDPYVPEVHADYDEDEDGRDPHDPERRD